MSLPLLRPTSGTGYTSDTSISAGQLDVAKPSSMKDGDYLVCMVTNKGGGLPTCTGGADWELLGDATSGNAMAQGTTRGAVFGKVVADAASEPATYAIGNVSDSAVAQVMAYSFVDSVNPVQGFNIESCTAPDHTIAGLTTDRADVLIVGMAMKADNVINGTVAGNWGCATDPTSLTAPTGGDQTSSAGSDCGCAFATAAQGAAGATGDFHWTPNSTDADSVVAILALNPDRTPTWRSDTTAVVATTGDLSPTKPSGLADGDLLLVFAASKTGAPTGVTGGAGTFTEIQAATVSGLDLKVYGKIITNAAGEPATYTVTCPGTGDVRVAGTCAVRDVSASYLAASAAQGNASGTNQAPAVTAEARTLIVGFHFNGDDGGYSASLVYTDPSAMTTELTVNTLSGTDMCGNVRSARKQTAGSTGTGAFTPANAAINVAITLALRGEIEGEATAVAEPNVAASGQKAVESAAAASAHPTVTAIGTTGSLESHSGSATAQAAPRCTASGVALVTPTVTSRSSMMF